MPINEHALEAELGALETRFAALADRVWATPETCYEETQSSAAHIAELDHHGFQVKPNAGEVPNAILAESGTGGPIIAFLGEYDALSSLSQKADVAHPDPVEPDANGHGCGHNMLGAGAMMAAVAIRNWLRKHKLPGRVRYYGCPAEEGGAGKTFMVAAGLFRDVDIAITWHPSCITQIIRGSSLASSRIDFTFHGRSSHAAASPHLGRSALDAAELMNIGANYLREHMPDEDRLHYTYLDVGGCSPNVVPSRARVRYVARSPRTQGLGDLIARLEKVAQGAALMTETHVQTRILTAVAEIVPNDRLAATMEQVLRQVGPPAFDDDDKAYAAKFQATLDAGSIKAAYEFVGCTKSEDKALYDVLLPEDHSPKSLAASTDVGDVSWCVPTVQIWGANYAIGTSFHTWQMVAQGKSRSAYRGMFHAAKVMAMTAKEAFCDPDLVREAKAELEQRAGTGYTSLLPADARPGFD
ncbi:amidohydrolase [Celeribacter sp.]|uniref:amidohydrolase n=1 Tax=Celeribacter sp. TaxID=1890673 RepID=UPI003A92355B